MGSARVVVLAGGVGAARFLRGLLAAVDPSSVTAIVNTADDVELYGLHVSPDLDTVTYTLANAVDGDRGWGLVDETWSAMGMLKRYGDDAWFNLGDQDLGTHLYRTKRLAQGATLSQVTAEIVEAWGLGLEVLPMSDQRVQTHVVVDGNEIGFQDYFVRQQHNVAVSGIRFDGAEIASPAPGVLERIAEADVIVIAPSNPLVSIGPILAVPGVRAALTARRDEVVAVSPIIGGAALKGPADRMLTELGHESSAVGVASLYASLASALVLDSVDSHLAEEIEAAGVTPVVTETVMQTIEIAEALARRTLNAIDRRTAQ
jgi:LPPG:FO 2-phospho-L-lactate transferase